MIFDLNQLEAILERKLTDDERKDILEYAAHIQEPKPEVGDPKYHEFMTCRHNVFSLYRQAAEKIGADTESIDKIISEYTPEN